MRELDRDTRAFLESALDADRPSMVDRERVRAKLVAQLGPLPTSEPSHGETSASAGPSLPSGTAGVSAGASSTVVIAAVSAFVISAAIITRLLAPAAPPESGATTPGVSSPPPASEPRALEVPSTPPTAVPPAAPMEPSRRVPPSPRRSRAKTPSSSELAAEAQLMASVQLALRDGAPSRALELLEDYDHRFPRGSLRVERWAAHALALCALGRREEAEGSRERVQALAPSSPLLARLDAACGSSAASDE